MPKVQQQSLGRIEKTSSFSATSSGSANSTTLGAQCYNVMVTATTSTYLAIGASTVTSATGTLLVANWPYVFTCTPSQVIAVNAVTGGGTVHICELS